MFPGDSPPSERWSSDTIPGTCGPPTQAVLEERAKGYCESDAALRALTTTANTYYAVANRDTADPKHNKQTKTVFGLFFYKWQQVYDSTENTRGGLGAQNNYG